MAVPTYPGVYVEEVASGVRPIEAASTSTPAFIGFAEMGPDDDVLRITSWTEYQRNYGGFIEDSHLAQSVFQFFNNGGRQCYVVRVTRSGEDDPATAASATIANRADTPTDGLVLSARSKGAWGNSLLVTIEDGSDAPGNEFKLTVRRQVDPDVLPKDISGLPSLEEHDNLSMDPDSPHFVETVIAARSSLISASVTRENVALQRGSYRGGDGPRTPLGDKRNLLVSVDSDGFQSVALPEPLASEEDLATVAKAIQDAVQALKPIRTSTPAAAFSNFACTVDDAGGQPQLLLQSGSTGSRRSSVGVRPAAADTATFLLKLNAADGGRALGAFAVRRPAANKAVQLGDDRTVAVTRGLRRQRGPVADRCSSTRSLGSTDKTDFSLLAVPGESVRRRWSNEALGYCGTTTARGRLLHRRDDRSGT